MLTAKRVERTKTPGRHRCGLVRGLYLQVSDNGAKSWVLRFEQHGRERMMGLGSASEFSLKEARGRARTARQLLADGVDPLARKQADKAAAKLAAARKLAIVPRVANPCAMPIPKPRSCPSKRHFSIIAPIAVLISSAIRTAWRAGFSTGTGSLKMTITPSPANRSSVPPYLMMICPIAAW